MEMSREPRVFMKSSPREGRIEIPGREESLGPDEKTWKSLSHVRLFVTPQNTVLGILQARILEWVAVPFSRGLIKQGGPNTELALMLKQFTEAKQNLSL